MSGGIPRLVDAGMLAIITVASANALETGLKYKRRNDEKNDINNALSNYGTYIWATVAATCTELYKRFYRP